MENQPVGRKKRRSFGVNVLLGLAALVGLIFLCALIGGWYLRGKLPDELKKVVHEQTAGLYSLDFDNLRVNLITGNVRLQGLSLTADTNVYFDTGDSSNVLFNLTAEEFSLRGIQVWHYLMDKELHVEGIRLERPAVFLLKMKQEAKNDSTKDESLLERVPKPLRGLELAYIDVKKLSFSENRIGLLHQKGNQLSGISFRIEDILLDSSARSDTTRVWFSKHVEIDSKDIVYSLADSMYIFNIDHLVVSSKEKDIRLEGFQVIPQLDELAFSRKLGTEGDRYDVMIPSIELNSIDFKGLETQGRLFADSLVLTGGDVKIFNNKTLPETGKNKIRNAPHLALQRLGMPVNIRQLILEDFKIQYREKSPESNRVGDVLFTNLNGAFTNITNDSIALAKDHWATSHFEMDFLDKARIKVDLNLNLSSSSGEFNYKGSMAPSNVTAFNSLMQPLAMVKATKGHIDRIAFDLTANQKGASGSVDFRYKNLEVDLLIKDNSGDIGTRGLVSFLANEIVIIPNNPEPGEAVRLPKVHYVHPSTRSFFNLMWKGIFEGIKETASAVGNDAKTKKAKEKEQRKEARRERRRQRRSERQSRR